MPQVTSREEGRPVLVFVVTWLVAATLLGLGNTVGYHRLLTHRSFRCGPRTRALWTLLGALHSGSPRMWVGLHRLHHNTSDQDGDPHSPKDSFWWGHCGWIIGVKSPLLAIPFALSGFGQQLVIVWHDLERVRGRRNDTWLQLTPDMNDDRLMVWLDRPGVMPSLFLGQLGLALMVGGGWGLLWLYLLHLFLTNGSWAVNSVCHDPRFGFQTHTGLDRSRNVDWVALFTNGEGYHNNHHRYPRSAWHALGPGPDLSYLVIRAMAAVGLATDVWLPRAFRGKDEPSTSASE